MAETDINILVRVKDEASAAMGKIGGTINNLQPAFKTMAVAGTAALGAIGAIAYKSIKDYGEAEKAAKQLEHATLAVAGGTREQLKALQDLSVELEHKGVLDGDAIATGLAQLQTFGLSTDMVTKLGSSMADLAVNQFGVSAGAEELTQTANIMAKALNGQFGVLEKSGIRFTDAQKKLIQFGTESERVAALQEGLAQNLKYTNDVAKTTVEGSMAKLQVQFGNISENVGAALIPALTKLVEKITPIVEKIVEWSSKNPDLIIKVGAVALAVAGLVTGIGLLGIALPAIITGFGFIAVAVGAITLPVIAVVAGIAALIAIGVLVYKNWDEIKAKATEIWGAIKEFFAQTFDGIKIIFTETWNSITTFFSTAWENIKEVFKIAIALIAGIISLAFEAIGIDIFAWIENLKNWFSTMWEFIKNAFNLGIEFVKTLWGLFWNGLKTVFTPIWETLKSLLSAGWDFIKGLFDKFLPPIAEGWHNVWNGISSVLTTVMDTVKKTISGTINYIIDKVNSVIKAINRIASSGAGKLGINISAIPEIPKLAAGGIVTKPTIAMIGEAGAEAVVPLSKAGKFGFGGGIVINLQGTFMTSEEQADYYGDILGMAIKRQVRV